MHKENAFVPEGTSENVTAEGSQPQSEELKTEASPSATQEAVEQAVPYSRFRTVTEARREAERKAEEAEMRLQEVLRERDSDRYERKDYSPGEPYRGSLPAWFSKMYGDDNNSRLAYSYWLEGQKETAAEIRREAAESIRQERDYETQTTKRNVMDIDNRIADFEVSIGRNLSEAEEGALLEIVDEYTPTDKSGKYAGDLISLDKAWEVLQMRLSNQAVRQARFRATPTKLTSTRTQGEPNTKGKPDEKFDPKDWNAFRKRIPADY